MTNSPSTEELVALFDEALDLIPRIRDDDPIAPALAAWCCRADMLRVSPRPDPRQDEVGVTQAGIAVAVEMGCGLTIDGERALCDDPRATERKSDCECRAAARAAIASMDPVRQEKPFAYAHRYPSAFNPGKTEIRFGTGGATVNGSPPIEAIPLYTKPPADPVRQVANELREALRFYASQPGGQRARSALASADAVMKGERE